MTPELKTACEVIFQEHKLSLQPIKWNKDVFRGKVSLGLSEMAKETLVRKSIILMPDKTKKIITRLNPAVANAGSVEEAEKILVSETASATRTPAYDPEAYLTDHVYGYAALASPIRHVESSAVKQPWYLKPIFCYLLLPVAAIAAGILLTLLLTQLQAQLFFG